jgi:hypothetical protein
VARARNDQVGRQAGESQRIEMKDELYYVVVDVVNDNDA